MTSRLLANLNERISSSTDELSRACFRAQRAAYLGRRGDEVEASAEIVALRQINSAFGDPVLSAWIHIAEGVVELTVGRHPAAADKFERARAIARAVNMPREASIAVTWLAYIDFTRNDIPALVCKVNAVARLKMDADASARARAKMLVGQTFHYAGKFDEARLWYEAARELAVEAGDDVLMSALLFNIASHHVSNYRQSELRGGLTSAPIRLLALTTDSVSNCDRLVGINSLDSYGATLLASVHMFHERFSEAALLFERFIDLAETQGLKRMKSPYLADLAYCLGRLGDLENARQRAERAEFAISDLVHVDDLAATRSRLAQTFELLGDADASAFQRKLADQCWCDHENLQRTFLEHLGRLEEFVAGSGKMG